MAKTPGESSANEARLLKLEEKVAFQDKLIADLNDVVVALHRLTDALSVRLRNVESALRSEVGARDVPNEKPPHY
jgi:uncharacterized coiled-coil protein SlyX